MSGPIPIPSQVLTAAAPSCFWQLELENLSRRLFADTNGFCRLEDRRVKSGSPDPIPPSHAKFCSRSRAPQLEAEPGPALGCLWGPTARIIRQPRITCWAVIFACSPDSGSLLRSTVPRSPLRLKVHSAIILQMAVSLGSSLSSKAVLETVSAFRRLCCRNEAVVTSELGGSHGLPLFGVYAGIMCLFTCLLQCFVFVLICSFRCFLMPISLMFQCSFPGSSAVSPPSCSRRNLS